MRPKRNPKTHIAPTTTPFLKCTNSSVIMVVMAMAKPQALPSPIVKSMRKKRMENTWVYVKNISHALLMALREYL